jgi:hypothetical protein
MQNDTECDSWVEFFDELAVVDYESMMITWTLDQQHWFDKLEERALYQWYGDMASYMSDYHPTVLEFRLRFQTFEPTCVVNCEIINDEVTILINSSGESQGNLCAYETLTVSGEMTTGKTYSVKDT